MGRRQGTDDDGRLAARGRHGPLPIRQPGSSALFRRPKYEPSDTEPQQNGVPTDNRKKGRPTPSRRDAEAANRAKAKVPRTRKEQAAARRLSRGDSSAKMREAMRTGDERYLPARDRGPVRRFLRDYVDHSFSILELMLPAMVVLLFFGYSGSTTLATYSNAALPALLLLVLAETFRLRWRLRQELTRRFPGESKKGATTYVVMRALQIRPLRQPKPQVKMGAQLPDRYH
jgi:Protein of unknown function (DUF3043)